jgi:hypothetical protein
MNGEITIVTKDGETITIKISTDGEEDEESPEISKLEVGSVVKVEADKVEQVEKATKQQPAITDTKLSDILPPLNSIEDVFRVLGVLEDAIAFREKGLTWEHIARELGYTADSMHLRLQDIGEEYLRKAKESGLITHEQFEYKFDYFNELAMKWVKEIFGEDI